MLYFGKHLKKFLYYYKIRNQIMLYTFISMCRNIQLITKPMPPLGRWSTNNKVDSTIRSILANHDCCGDRLCGNPLNVKEQIDRALLEKNQNVKN